MAPSCRKTKQNRELGEQNKHKSGGVGPIIPYKQDPRQDAADLFITRNDWGLSYTRRQALKRYHVLIRSNHHPKIVLDCYSRQTFPNRYQSIAYHHKKHGKNLSIGQYTESALAFFIENYYRAKLNSDRLGKKSWNIKGTPGGWFTRLGRIITFWF